MRCGRVRPPAEVDRDFHPLIIRRLEQGMPLHSMARAMLGQFHGKPGARTWRGVPSEKAPGAWGRDAIAVYNQALAAVQATASQLREGV